MKKLLTLIGCFLLFSSCNTSSNSKLDYTDHEFTTIQKFYQNKEKDKEKIDIEILQVDDITSENFEIRKTGSLLFEYYAEQTDLLSQSQDSIQNEYNQYINLIKSIDDGKKIGKIVLTKVTTVSKNRVEKTEYIPTILNNNGNIPSNIDNLLKE